MTSARVEVDLDPSLVERLEDMGISRELRPTIDEWSGCLVACSQLLAEREEEVQQRSRRALDVLTDQAQGAARVIEAFLARMGHELRTPMAVVLGAYELLAESPLDPEQRAALDAGEGAARMLTRVIDEILDFCRLEAGDLGLVSRPCHLRAVFEDLVSSHRARCEAKGLEFQSRWHEDLPAHVVVDERRFRQVLDALLDNACKFTSEGWVGISSELDLEQGNSVRARFSVSDSGPGISQKALPHLFSPFRQADETPSRRSGGAGVGLALANRLVELMGGELHVSSVAGCGTTCTAVLELRRSRAESVRPALEIGPRHPIRTPPRVLVAEDNTFNRSFILRALEPLGCDIESVENGRQVLQVLSEREFDLVIMDVQMPEMDGLTATRRMRETCGRAARVPVLALTANALHGDRQRCVEAGMDDFLAKPVSVSHLRGRVAAWLGIELNDDGVEPPPTVASPRRRATDCPSHVLGVTDRPGRGTPLAAPDDGESLSAGLGLASLDEMGGVLDLGRFEELMLQAGSDDIVRELSQIFIEDMEGRLAELSRASAAGDREETRRLAHAVKGSSGNFGAVVMAEVAARLERDPASSTEHEVATLYDAFNAVREALRQSRYFEPTG